MQFKCNDCGKLHASRQTIRVHIRKEHGISIGFSKTKGEFKYPYTRIPQGDFEKAEVIHIDKG